MKLKLRNGYSFTLTIAGYEFPDLKDVPYDSNWLNVKIDVEHPDGDWTTADPALQTYEVKWLADWFRVLAAGGRDERNLGFLEPCLEFEVASMDSSEVLKVTLAHEFRPPWFESIDDEEFELTFPLATIDLIKAAEDLERDLARFPQRTAQ